MKAVLSIAITALLSTSLAGCFVRTRDRHHHHHHGEHSKARSRDCPPSHHWRGDRCVPNSRGRDHRR